MTDFTPEIRVMYLPPNTIHSAAKTEITTWVDYNINISRGTDEYINPPYPGGCTLSLLFDENYIPEIELGSWIEIQVKNSFGTWTVLQAGNVVNRSSQYRSFGIAGFVLEWQFVITSTISLLQNTTFYVNQYTEGLTDGLVAYIEEESTVLNWFAVNRELTWENFGPQAWDEVDTYRQNDFPVFNYGLDTNDQALDEGSYNTWETLVKLVYGVYGWIYEGSDGELYFNYGETALSSEMTFTADMLNPDLIGGDRFESLRNIVEITKFDAGVTTYYENESTSLYGDRSGTLETNLLLQANVNDIGQKILNSLAYPLLSTQQISVNLLNPIFTNTQRNLLLGSPIGNRVTVQAPSPMGGTLDYIIIGCNYEINRNEYLVNLKLAPYSQVYNTINWDQVPYNYTWTSYGVAFPTQEWQDL
jgi:hypothetical protein